MSYFPMTNLYKAVTCTLLSWSSDPSLSTFFLFCSIFYPLTCCIFTYFLHCLLTTSAKIFASLVAQLVKTPPAMRETWI